MAKKNKKTEVSNKAVSSFNGRLLNLIGTNLLQLLVIVIMAAVGVVIAYVLGTVTALTEGAEFGLLPIVGAVLAVIFVWIGLCWAGILFIKWETKHTVISGYQLTFKSSAMNLFFNVIKWTFLSIITLTIYAWWLPIKVRKWRVKHTIATPVEAEADNTNASYANPQITYYTTEA